MNSSHQKAASSSKAANGGEKIPSPMQTVSHTPASAYALTLLPNNSLPVVPLPKPVTHNRRSTGSIPQTQDQNTCPYPADIYPKPNKRKPTTCWAPNGSKLGQQDHWMSTVINLKRRSDRKQNMQKLLETKAPAIFKRTTFLEATDGKKIQEEEMQSALFPDAYAYAKFMENKPTIRHADDGSLIQYTGHITRGALGCAFSHREAWRRIAMAPAHVKWGLVMEDDLKDIVPNVEKYIENIEAQLPARWDACYLGYHNHEMAELWNPMMGFASPAELVSGPAGTGLYAYMLSREGAQFLLNHAFPLKVQVDTQMEMVLKMHNRPAFHLDERLFYSPTSEEGQDSDIQKMKKEGGSKVAPQANDWLMGPIQMLLGR